MIKYRNRWYLLVIVSREERDARALQAVEGADVTKALRAAHAASLDRLEERPRVLLVVLRNGLTRRLVLDYARDFSRK